MILMSESDKLKIENCGLKEQVEDLQKDRKAYEQQAIKWTEEINRLERENGQLERTVWELQQKLKAFNNEDD